ncbi:MAG: RNA-binding protein [Gammaproteobacteria bacterium]|nr:RNA-binding protein [Gammaproteobacteria bacterium]
MNGRRKVLALETSVSYQALAFREPGDGVNPFLGATGMQQNKLFVGNLAFSATQDDVEALFADYGELNEVRLITDRDSGQSRGFAFVTFAAQKDAESALEMDGKTINGRNLVVNIAKEKTKTRTGRGGGGRRY